MNIRGVQLDGINYQAVHQLHDRCFIFIDAAVAADLAVLLQHLSFKLAHNG